MAPHNDAYPAMAITTIATLLSTAKTMFWLIFATACCPSLIAVITFRRSESMSMTCAFSIAICVPAAPIAMPTSATARAAASLMPSPSIAVVPRGQRCWTSPLGWRPISSSTVLTLSSGRSSGYTWVMPSFDAMASAVGRLSPVSIQTLTFSSLNDPSISLASCRGASATLKMATGLPSIPK